MTTDPSGTATSRRTDPTTGLPSGSPAATPADSPMTQYTARAVGTVLMVGVLVTALLGGAFLILNLGLLSKRREDRIGGRTPSDLGILKTQVWPQEAENRRVLPAMEDEDEGIKEQFYQQPEQSSQPEEPPHEPKPLRKIG